jgi:thiol-disulfide isomerase/thioredoxin
MEIDAMPGPHTPLVIRGSKAQADWNELESKTLPLRLAIDSLSQGVAHGAPNPQRVAINVLQAQLAKENYVFFSSHPHSFVTADQVKFFMNAYSLDSIKAIYNSLSPELKETVAAKMLALNIKSREAGLPGTMAAAFTVKDREGKDLSLSDFKGKYVLLDFWATWCVPCRASMPHMISLYQKYKDRNFDMIGVGDDDRDPGKWVAAIDKDGTGLWHQVLRGMNVEMFRSGKPNPRDLGEQYGIRALPTKILVDPEGKIIGRYTGSGPNGTDPDLDKMLEQMLIPATPGNK